MTVFTSRPQNARVAASSAHPPYTTLSAPRFDARAGRAYERALRALREDRVPFLLGGAVALNAHTGIWRDTKDLDVFLRPQDADAAMRALDARGFACEYVYESWLGKAWHDDVFVDLIWRNANGLFPVTDEWLSRGAPSRVLGIDVAALPLEELLVSKMMVMGRYRFDGADILHLLFVAGEHVDWDRLARLCGEHVGVMLAHLHVFRYAYPAWRDRIPTRVLDEFARLAEERASTLGDFRGRLLDLPSYNVDVEEWAMPDAHRRVLDGIFGNGEGRE